MNISGGPREPQAVVASELVQVTPAVAAALSEAQPAPGGASSAHDVAIAELQRLLGAWRVHEPGARLGEDPEELHQLRVTARRIDATIALFKRQLPRALLRTRKTTKIVLRSLGAARDLDVQLEELARYCARLPEREQAAAQPLRAFLERERAQARERMLRSLDSEPVRHWLETLTLSGAVAARARGTDRAMAVVPERVQRRYRKLRKSVGRLRAKASMEDYHLVRRRAKQLRYATECGALMFGKPADELLKALRRLQDGLGAHQDAYMAQTRLAALAADPSSALPAPTLFLMGRLAEHHAQITAQARQTLARAWRKVRGRRWRALRTRLSELRESATALPDVLAAIEAANAAPAQLTAVRAAESDSRSLKH
jgi:CHAD domain-containing protein